jgi:glycosyltransferase involved in cell wall biosynthesis
LLAGGGPLRASLEGRERVHLLGVRDDIPNLLAAADVFALASSWEGLPLAVIEAMAAGLPVVATDVGSVSEAVVHGKTGMLAPSGNGRLLIEALLALTTDAARRREMGAAARQRAQAFGVRTMVESYENLFTELLSRRPGRTGTCGCEKDSWPAGKGATPKYWNPDASALAVSPSQIENTGSHLFPNTDSDTALAL